MWSSSFFLPILNFFRDNIWQVILGILAIIVTITLWMIDHRRQQSRKILSYDIETDTPLVSVEKEFSDRISIAFDGRQLSAASLVILKFRNSGDLPISREDYIDPIQVDFTDRKILSVDIQEMEPKKLLSLYEIQKLNARQNVSNTENSIYVPPVHFNTYKKTKIKEFFSLKILLEGSKGDISVLGRLNEGAIQSSRRTRKKTNFDTLWVISAVGIGIGTYFGLIPKFVQDNFIFQFVEYTIYFYCSQQFFYHFFLFCAGIAQEDHTK